MMDILTALGLALLPFIFTAIIYWIVKTWKIWGGIGIAVVIFILGFILFYSVITANAESAIVSFDDAEHLAAISDSIVGACDRDSVAIGTSESTWEIWFKASWMDEPDSFQSTSQRILYDKTITCRRLVCVTVETHAETVVDTVAVSYDGFYDDLFPTKIIPGKAIIFYEEEK